jgi:hypothetical protein
MTTPTPRKRQPRTKKPTAGARLVADLSRDDDPYSLTVMITEASRIADRLDRLAALLAGEKSAWLSLRAGRDGVTEVKVDNALQEARAQATTLRGLLYEIHRQRANIQIEPGDDDDLAGI